MTDTLAEFNVYSTRMNIFIRYGIQIMCNLEKLKVCSINGINSIVE
jgi:hypothetical protein